MSEDGSNLTTEPVSAESALAGVWRDAGLPDAELAQIDVPEAEPSLPSSFNVGAAAQASIGAAALAAELIYAQRTGVNQDVRVPRSAAELECTGYFQLDGTTPRAWAKFSGLYAAADGHVRIHANFDHHRDGVLELLGLSDASQVEREELASALSGWRAEAFEDQAAERGLVVAMVRSFDAWDRHPHAIAARDIPLVGFTKIGDAPAASLSACTRQEVPLKDVRVLDLTRVLAGPICGRTLAAYGADVLLVNSPDLPNISAIIDTSRGKRSTHIDLKQPEGAAMLERLLADTHVFVQGYRPGGLEHLDFGPEAMAARHPGIVYVSLSAYGNRGPWSTRRGFDSLVQTATGFNHAEAEAAGADKPRTLPMPILDFASGYLMAFGAQAALLKQAREGGSWHVEVSLLGTANWLRSLGRLPDGLERERPDLDDHLVEFPCSDGTLTGMAHAAEFSTTPATWRLQSALPGAHAAEW